MQPANSIRPEGIIPTQNSWDLQVLDLEGKQVQLVSLWQNRKIALFFLRQFGCLFCRQQSHALCDIVPTLKDKDVIPVILGLGSVERAKKYVEEMNWKGEIYVDINPLRPQAHPMFHLQRKESSDDLIGDPRTQAAYANATSQGFDSDPPETWKYVDVFQNGGVFVLGPGNVCDYAYRSEYAGDHPPLEDVVKAATNEDSKGGSYISPVTQQWAVSLKATERVPDPVVIEPIPNATTNTSSDTKTVTALGVMACATMLLSYALFKSFLIVFGEAILLLYFAFRRLSATTNNDVVPRDIPYTSIFTTTAIDKLWIDLGGGQFDCGFVDETEMCQPQPKEPHKSMRAPFPLLQPSAEINRKDQLKCLLRMSCYFREFLAKPHPLVGRPGPVCPFVPSALKMDLLYLALVYATPVNSISEVKTVVRKYIDLFRALEPTKGPRSLYRTLILVFPSIPLRLASTYIDKVQYDLKSECVQEGIMIGEFHLNNNACGLRNPDFYPLRTPYPCLALRGMVPGDLVFLTPDKYPSEMRVELLQAFVKNYDTEDGRQKIKPLELEIGKDALAEAIKQRSQEEEEGARKKKGN